MAWAVVVATALAVECLATWHSVEQGTSARDHWTTLAAALLAFTAAAWAVRRLPARWAAVAVLGGCVVLIGAALHTGPNSSQDWVRYAWDGRVQLHGIDPYRYAPNSAALEALRSGFLRPSARCAVSHPANSCFRVDRAGVLTIYPPVAQAVFAVVEAIAGRTARPRPFQLTGAVAILAVTGLLLAHRPTSSTAADGRTPVAAASRAAVWAWCPLVIIQYVNNAHIDAVAIVFAVLGLIAASRPATPLADVPTARRWAAAAGALIGVGVGIKVLPVLLLPGIGRGRPARTLLSWLAAAAVVAVSYIPHVLAVGPAVVGYLPGYLHEEGYDNGQRFHLIVWFVHGPRATEVAVAALAVIAVVALVRSRTITPDLSALLVVGGFLMVATPTYPWYGGLLVAVAAFAYRPRWVLLALAGLPTYGAGSLGLSIDDAGHWAYTVAALLVVLIPLVRVAAHAGRDRRATN